MKQVFAFRVADLRGKTSRGTVAASTEESAARELQQRGLFPLEIKPAVRKRQQSTRGVGASQRGALLEATRATAALLLAGMPVARALAATANASGKAMNAALLDVCATVERGATVTVALRAHGGLFSSFYCGIVEAGEKSGKLGDAFNRLARHLEREEELRNKLLSLSIYPALLMLVGAAAVAVLMIFALPRFVNLLGRNRGSAPAGNRDSRVGHRSSPRWHYALGLILPFRLLQRFSVRRWPAHG
jgi:general secretion pathway protein F